MKLVTYIGIVSIGLFSEISHSYPRQGDYVRFEANYKDSKVQFEKEIISEDSDAEIFEVRSFYTYKGQILKEQIVSLPKTFLFTPEKIKHVLETCVQREGALGEITLQNKKIKLCEYYNEDSQLTDMVGEVPFGQIRFQVYLEGETFLDFHLKEFKSIHSN
jgi:hypothetical protein